MKGRRIRRHKSVKNERNLTLIDIVRKKYNLRQSKQDNRYQ